MIMSRTPEERLNRSQWDVFLAVGNAVNGAKALGIDSSLMGGFNAKEYARILALPENFVPTLLVALGKAMDKPLPKVRFPWKTFSFKATGGSSGGLARRACKTWASVECRDLASDSERKVLCKAAANAASAVSG